MELAQKERNFIRELQESPFGEKGKFKEKFECDPDYKKIYESWGAIGAIKQGRDGENKERYKVTEFGNDYFNSVLSFETINRELDRIINQYSIK